MPSYLYKDANQHTQTVRHPMMFEGDIHCSDCQRVMWRVPQPVLVHWGGLAPSAETERHPEVQDMLANETKNRETFLERKAQRDADETISS